MLINQALGTFFLRLSEFQTALPPSPPPSKNEDIDTDSVSVRAACEPHNQTPPGARGGEGGGEGEGTPPQTVSPVRGGKGGGDRDLCYGEGKGGGTPWRECYEEVKRRILSIARLNHCIDVLSGNSHNDGIQLTLELQQQLRTIHRLKCAVRDALLAMVAINAHHRRFPELDAEQEDGMVEVEGVNCSRCHLPDSEGNDILFCDRKGCCRAYHGMCLDPPLPPGLVNSDPEEDWFCWECRCVADSLALINEMCGTSYEDGVEEVFDEVLQPAEGVEGALAKVLEGAWGGESSSEDDDDYQPGPRADRGRAEARQRVRYNDSDSGTEEEGEGAGSGGSCDESNEEEEEGEGGEDVSQSSSADSDNEDSTGRLDDDLDSELSGDEVSRMDVHVLSLFAGVDPDEHILLIDCTLCLTNRSMT